MGANPSDWLSSPHMAMSLRLWRMDGGPSGQSNWGLDTILRMHPPSVSQREL